VTTQKNVEENLEQSVDLLAALLDKEGSGILVEDEAMRVSHVNKEFFELLRIDAPAEQVAGSSSEGLFSKSKLSARRIESIRSGGIPIVDEEISLNGSVLNLNYVPLSISRMRRFHLWEFRDVIEKDSPETDGQSELSLLAMSSVLRQTYQATRNDLQVIYGVLKLQSNRVGDEQIKRYFAADQTRVMAIALVHERMSKSEDLENVDFPGYAKHLTEQLKRSYLTNSQEIDVNCEVAPLPVKIGTAIPCGLIINELVSNSLQYAFPKDRPGEISVRFGQLDSDNLRLTVQDNGIGFPRGFDFRKTSTLGMMLVTGLTQQLGGTIALRNENGTAFDISFPSNGDSRVQPSMPAPVENHPSHQTQTVS
jgi:two-component sensor histidine kinase